MKTNTTTRIRKPSPRTFGGAIAVKTIPEKQLLRLVMANMMFEDQFYIDGESSAKILADCIKKCDPEFVAETAVKVRTEFKLRHVPLYLARELARNPASRHVVAELLPKIVNRADEIAEFISIYWKEGKIPLANCVKKGLSACFDKFSEYAFAKYSGDKSSISLRDAMFLVHPKPAKGKAALYKRIANNELKSPETWENRLSRGEDKKTVFTEMVKDGELGALALLRNLRNMEESGVPSKLIRDAIMNMDSKMVLPFRFLSAIKHAPSYSAELESAMIRGLAGDKLLYGKTLLILDVSGSMGGGVSGKSDLTRFEAAAALAMLAAEICEDVTIYATAGSDSRGIHKTEKIESNLHGLKLKAAFDEKVRTLGGGGIFLTQCMDYISQREGEFDRVLCFTDEQDCDKKLKPAEAKKLGNNNYIVNIAAYQNGIGGKEWTTISGFSEKVLHYIAACESE